MEKEYLFHYTNLQSLALILQSKTFKFNSLMNVDDMEEMICQDIIYGGKYCFVSSWTEDEEESIPMWNLYSKLNGIRIKLKKNPFIRYSWNDPLCPDQKIESFFSLDQINRYDIFPYFPSDGEILYKVIYTNEKDKLYPKLKKDVAYGYHIDYERLGKYKRSLWEFQKEWRYILYIRPVKLSAYMESLDYGKQNYKYSITNNVDLPMSEIFLSIDQDCFNNIEIMCGPKMSKGEKILLECLMDKYCPSGTIKDSHLKLQ